MPNVNRVKGSSKDRNPLALAVMVIGRVMDRMKPIVAISLSSRGSYTLVHHMSIF